jgi:hypothetical protein
LCLPNDLRIAVASDVPVLISGPWWRTLALACRIADQGPRGFGAGLRICNVGVGDSLVAAFGGRDSADGASVVIREVQMLSDSEQAALTNLIVDRRRSISQHIIATSSIELHNRVRAGRFDERLFLLLSAIHIIVPADPRAAARLDETAKKLS